MHNKQVTLNTILDIVESITTALLYDRVEQNGDSEKGD
jgi:hypothetical protein